MILYEWFLSPSICLLIPSVLFYADIHKVLTIIQRDFSKEFDVKEKEILLISEKIEQIKKSLNRLRSTLLPPEYQEMASHLRSSDSRKGITTSSRNRVAEDKVKHTPAGTGSLLSTVDRLSWFQISPSLLEAPLTFDNTSLPSCSESNGTNTNFHFNNSIIVGNTSCYLLNVSGTASTDGATHKWMVYVKGDSVETEKHIKHVLFLLHPSYRPNDLVAVSRPPYQLVRRGWGEFPVRIQVHFCNPSNKPLDIIHVLKLDQLKTGRQMFGAETITRVSLTDVVPSNGRPHSTIHNKDPYYCTGQELPSSDTSSPPLPDMYPLLPFSKVLDQILNASHDFPLISKSKDQNCSGFSANSVAEYYSWSLSKRKACEWMRAVAIKNSLERCDSNLPAVTTKQIVLACRVYGQSPFYHSDDNLTFCSFCGATLRQEQFCEKCDLLNTVPVSSLFSVTDLVDEAATDDRRSQLAKSTKCRSTFLLESEGIEMINILLNQAKFRGFPISSLKLLLSAFTQFAKSLLVAACHECTCAEKTDSSSNNILTSSHIHKAINNLPYCIFLCNCGFEL